MAEDTSNPQLAGKGREFATTQWSVVVAPGAGGGPEAGAALAQLCQAYWYPLYAYVRRRVKRAFAAALEGDVRRVK